VSISFYLHVLALPLRNLGNFIFFSHPGFNSVNGTEFSLRKNGTDKIGLDHPGWAKVMKNAIFALSAKSKLYLDE
jgi:hypothetical protein